MNKAVIIYSGGLDSTVLLTKCRKEFDEVVALNFSYGSKHNAKERKAAVKICSFLNIRLFLYDLPTDCVEIICDDPYTGLIGTRFQSLLSSDLLKSGGEIPNGHYEDPTMKKTVVPYRNSIMLSIAAGFAESIRANCIAIANHKGDRACYPDCRREYIEAFSKGIRLGGYGEIIIYSPFVDMTKIEIVKLGVEIGAPIELSWSCYKGKDKPCLRCGTCQERIESFYMNGIKDPSLSDAEWAEALKVIGK